jgi:3-hydroxybutyryl-CoA dehydrogenase
MTIGVIAEGIQKEEILAQGLAPDVDIVWMSGPALLPAAAAIFDLLNLVDQYPADWLEKSDQLLFINQVECVNASWPAHFIRINGWPGFLQRPLLEASVKDPLIRTRAAIIPAAIHKQLSWVDDIPGFLTPRVLAAIINEAYLSLEEEVSTKEEIDTAMKLGTNYPYGPFEWAERIGINRVYKLLKEMAVKDKQYDPAALLKKEAGH